MPSVSGWALRLTICICLAIVIVVSMPSVSGWALRHHLLLHSTGLVRFYALGIGLGFATNSSPDGDREKRSRFYALGIGLGFATPIS